MFTDDELRQLAMLLEAYGLEKRPTKGALRQRRYRKKKEAASQNVTGESQNVTHAPEERHKTSRPVTKRHKGENGKRFELPDWVPVQQWDAWIEARTKKRNAPTEWAKELAVAKLDELRQQGHHPAAVLANSAFHGWADLFPVKEHH